MLSKKAHITQTYLESSNLTLTPDIPDWHGMNCNANWFMISAQCSRSRV
jgi:hypothetical protein